MNHLASAYPAIPIDLFYSKKHHGLGRGELGFADSSDNIAFRTKRQSSRSSSKSHYCKNTLLLDRAGNPLFSINLDHTKTWKVFKLDDGQEKQLMFTAQKTRHTLTRTEFDVFLSAEISDGSSASFKMKGFPFQRSCTIYSEDSIVAQTSLMYKLHQIYVKRCKFRLTIYPGSIDHALFVALVIIFLDG
ncbi:hypothetical protein SAY87_020413 [Trapa incisa]|uniref:Protein LURP-one-related 7 n=1 Tax=Trapa incisa TaxID=236973 RepID=A0AAN7K7Q6_9MYRT|nr:hypothetical protein SAY87_020413 [Trapa incisa]